MNDTCVEAELSIINRLCPDCKHEMQLKEEISLVEHDHVTLLWLCTNCTPDTVQIKHQMRIKKSALSEIMV